MSADDLMRRISDLVDEAIEDDPEAALQDPDDDGWEYRETTARWSAERAEVSDSDVDWTGWSGLGRELRDLGVTLGAGHGEIDNHWARTEAHARMVADQLTAQIHSTFGGSARLSFESTTVPEPHPMGSVYAAILAQERQIIASNPSLPFQHWIRGRLDVEWDAGSRAPGYLDVGRVRSAFENYRVPEWEPEFWRRAPDVLPSPLTAPTVTNWDVPVFDMPAHWEMFDGHNWNTISVPVTDIRWTSPTGPDLPQIQRVDLGEVRREQLTAALSSVLGPGAQISDWLSPRARADLMPPAFPPRRLQVAEFRLNHRELWEGQWRQ